MQAVLPGHRTTISHQHSSSSFMQGRLAHTNFHLTQHLKMGPKMGGHMVPLHQPQEDPLAHMVQPKGAVSPMCPCQQMPSLSAIGSEVTRF